MSLPISLPALQMLVQPLERIFHTIRTNAAQVVAALGPEVSAPLPRPA